MSASANNEQVRMMILLPDPTRDRRAFRTNQLSYCELLQYECVQGPAMSKAEKDSGHDQLSIRRERLRNQRVRLCQQ